MYSGGGGVGYRFSKMFKQNSIFLLDLNDSVCWALCKAHNTIYIYSGAIYICTLHWKLYNTLDVEWHLLEEII